MPPEPAKNHLFPSAEVLRGFLMDIQRSTFHAPDLDAALMQKGYEVAVPMPPAPMPEPSADTFPVGTCPAPGLYTDPVIFRLDTAYNVFEVLLEALPSFNPLPDAVWMLLRNCCHHRLPPRENYRFLRPVLDWCPGLPEHCAAALNRLTPALPPGVEVLLRDYHVDTITYVLAAEPMAAGEFAMLHRAPFTLHRCGGMDLPELVEDTDFMDVKGFHLYDELGKSIYVNEYGTDYPFSNAVYTHFQRRKLRALIAEEA